MASPDLHLDRLCEAIYRSRQDLERFRVERLEAVRSYLGSHWSDEGSPTARPLNLLALYIQVVGRSLIPKAPRVTLTTFVQKAKPAVATMEAVANKELQRMGIEDTFQRVVTDALFSIGICKVSLVDPAHSSLWGWDIKAGEAFAERIDLDDFVFDTHARDFREASFIGHRYRVPLSVIKDDPLYSPQRKDLQVSDDENYNREGDERINSLQRSVNQSGDEYEEMVDLWEIYLPRHKVLVTLTNDCVLDSLGGTSGVQFSEEPLRQWEWVGPDAGPYHFLAFGCVPGNAMPKSPIQDLIDLHTVTNELYVKLMRQGERQKEILTVQGAADSDGNRLMNANDGEIIRVDNPEKMKVATFGGPNQANLQFAIHLKDMYSYMAGNLDAMGGLAPQAKTLGQDKMLNESASRTVQDMQGTSINFVSEVCESLCWFWWHDPFKINKVEHQIPNMPETAITRVVHPKGKSPRKMGPGGYLVPAGMERDADWEDLELAVDPYSLQHQTPAAKVQAIMGVVQQVIMPGMPIIQQSGATFDIVKLLKVLGKYSSLPELSEFVTMGEPPTAPDQAGGAEAPGMPANTSREYIRRSLGGDSSVGREAELANMTSPTEGGGQVS